jgi:hypothetical protein
MFLLTYRVLFVDLTGLNSETVERRVGQVMISGPTTASDIPVPL